MRPWHTHTLRLAAMRSCVDPQDWLHAIVSAGAFLGIAMLTPPVTTCFWPALPPVIPRAGPILVAMAAVGLFMILRPARSGVGFSPVDAKLEEETEGVHPGGNPRADVENGHPVANGHPVNSANGANAAPGHMVA